MSIRADLRDAVAAVVDAGTYSRTHTVSNTYNPSSSLPDLDTSSCVVFVRVAPVESDAGRTRDNALKQLTIDVVVVGGVSSGEANAVDGLLDVAEEVEAELRKRANGRLTVGSETAHWLSSRLDGIVSDEEPAEDGLAQFDMSVEYIIEVPRG